MAEEKKPAPKPAAKAIDPEKKKAREAVKKAAEKLLLQLKDLEQAVEKDQA